MDDAQLKKQLDNIVAVLRGRLADANERKIRAEKRRKPAKRKLKLSQKLSKILSRSKAITVLLPP